MSMSKRKQVGKDDLRRLMKEKKNARTAKIDSPYAKYNTLDQLHCTVCGTHIKSNILWNAHVLGRSHKQNVEVSQSKAASKEMLPPSILKRRAEDEPTHSQPKQMKAGGGGALSLGLGDYSSSEEEDEQDADGGNATNAMATNSAPGTSSLPADFFDSGVTPSAPPAEEESEPPKPAHMSEVLPEGFFDDPKKDAKARNVEYRDKLEDEWELFQKQMKEENTVSEQIIADEDEINTEERRLEEIDDQLLRWTKIDALGKKKDALMQNKATDANENDSDSDVDDEEFNEFLDWRTKASTK